MRHIEVYLFKNQHLKRSIIILIMILFVSGCKKETKWKGQPMIKKVSTSTVPIEMQNKGVFPIGQDVFLSNDFSGARLNSISHTNDTLITAFISPENQPINESPWYAFKIWSASERNIYLKLTYSDDYTHRYYPKVSLNGHHWQPLDSSSCTLSNITTIEDHQVAKDAMLHLSIGPDTLWVAAQELATSHDVNEWTQRLDTLSFVAKVKIGQSKNGKAIHLLKIGKSDDQKMLIVIARQHPPEVTGYLAMQQFIETICSENEMAKDFRSQYNTYVIPLMNPDGVDMRHWRHSAGGIDLNRDWNDFNQPETAIVRDFLDQNLKSTGGKYYFTIDFHSTWEDIFYTINPKLKGNMPGLVPKLIASMGAEFNDYDPNIQPIPDTIGLTSSTFFFYKYGAESLVYEVGDNTPRQFVKRKGEVTAWKLMELMLKRNE